MKDMNNIDYEDLAKIGSSDVKKLVKKVDVLINFLKLLVLGPTAITPRQMASILVEGWMKKPEDIQLNNTIPSIYIKTLGVLGGHNVPETVRNRTIKYLMDSGKNYANSVSQKLKNDIHSIIGGEAHFNQKANQILLSGTKSGSSVDEMAEKLAKAFGRFSQNWEMFVRTELSHAQNLGAVDSILSNNKEKSIEEIIVYKQTANDGRMCKHCKRFWHWENNFKIPKVYRMSELAVNNTSRNLDESKASIAPQHPQCRCLLLQLPNGYGFKEDGAMAFLGEHYSEYNRQRS